MQDIFGKRRDTCQLSTDANKDVTMKIPSPSKKRVGVGVLQWGTAFILILIILVNSIDSASLTNNANNPPRGIRRRVRGIKISSTVSPGTTAFSFSDENKRLLRLESASPLSYLYRYRAPRTTATPPTATSSPIILESYSSNRGYQQSPRVLLRLNGQTGVIQRRQGDDYENDNLNFVPVTPPPITTTTTTPAPNFALESEDVEDVDYPYQFYLDFDEDQSKKEYLSPQSSEHFKPSASLAEQQSSIWNEFIHSATSTTASTTPSPLPLSYWNEINDNYTIPSLRDYRFPQYKTITTTTAKPGKPDYLNPYEFFSEEDLENVADLDLAGDHSKYFVKTKPRDVSSSVSNLYNSFYYEPPSYSTKTIPLPVKAIFPQGAKNKEEDDKLKFKWNHNQLNFNYFDGLTTLPMNEPTTSTIPFSFPPFSPSTAKTTTTPIVTNYSEYESYPTVERQDVASAESIVVLASKASNPDFNSIPDFDSTTSKVNLFSLPSPPTSAPISSTTEATSIPGLPGIDYPTFDTIPATGFDCSKQRYKGFFADIETKCQVWHYCDFADGHSSFLCPNGTLFSQVLLTCDWWFNVNCVQAQQLYVLNERLYRYIKPPKPSFPEDYHGPQVDLWLKKQLELGLLPKIKKRGKFLDKPTPTTLREKVFHDAPTTPPPNNEE